MIDHRPNSATGVSIQTLTVRAKDAFGNNIITGGSIVVIAKLSGSGTIGPVVDHGDGTYTANVTSPVSAGSGVFVATLNALEVRSGTGIQTQSIINYTSGPVNATASTLTPATASITANGISQQVLTVTAKDANGNNVATGGAIVTITRLSGFGTVGPVTDMGNGTYTANVSSLIAGVGFFGATLNGLEVRSGSGVQTQSMITYTAGPADATASTLTPTGASIPGDGISTQLLTVHAKDATGNTVTIGGAIVSISRLSGTGSIGAVTDHGDGTYTAIVTSPSTPGSGVFVAMLNGLQVRSGTGSQTQALIGYTAGPANAAASTLTPIFTSFAGIGLRQQILTVQAKDANGFNLTTGGSIVTITKLFSTGTIAWPNTANDNGNGTYTAAVGLAVPGSNGIFVASLDGQPVKSGMGSQTQAFITYTAEQADATASTLTPASSSILADGFSTQILTVTAKDAIGNNLTTGGSFVTLARLSGTGTVGAVTDMGNGTYNFVVTAPSTPGSGHFAAMMNGLQVRNGTGFWTEAVVNYTSNSNANLAGISLNNGALIPAFSSTTTNYYVPVANTVNSITISPVTSNEFATVKVNGQPLNGNPSANLALGVGINTIVIEVTAQDGVTVKTYIVTVIRETPVLPYSESFRYSTAAGMVYGGSAILTAVNADPEGAGYLRLTNNTPNSLGFARNTTAFPTANGLSISVEYYIFGGSGGDGLSMILYDPTANPFQIGAFGGSLGYAQSTNAPGLPGVSKGYIGIGLDEFGNFSNPTAGRQGGPGLKPNSVALRGDGDGAAAIASNYEYLTGIQTINAAAMSAAGAGSTFQIPGAVNGRTAISLSRPQGGLTATDNGYRKARIELRPNGLNTGFIINGWITEGNPAGGIVHHVVTEYSYVGSTLPTNLSIAFAASTGGSNSFHEVRNLAITVPSATESVPTVTNFTKTGTENVTVPFTAYNFTSNFSSPVNNSLAKIKVLSLPLNGTLRLNNLNIEATQEINLSDLSGISFVPNNNYIGSATFQWNGSDGTQYSASNASVTITLLPTGTLAFPYHESFKNSTAAGMVFGGSPAASLTAGGPDANGAGYLRLTNNATNQLGFSRNNTAFPTADGYSISFEYYAYGGTGADGFTFSFFDAIANGAFQVGAGGGSLGYAQNSTLPGLSKGYLSIGLDEGGNFSTNTGGRVGGPGVRASSVTIRGDGNGTGAVGGTNYEYLTNIQTSNAAAMTAAGGGNAFQEAGGVNGRTGGAGGLGPNNPGYRKARIRLDPIYLSGTDISAMLVNVWITEGNAAGPIEHHVVIDYKYVSTNLVPANLSYAFTGANGGSTNYHEIRNLDILLPSSVVVAPVAVADLASTLASTPVSFNVAANDYDVTGNSTLDLTTVDLDPFTPGRQTAFNVINEGSYGVDNTGTITFSPQLGFSGNATPILYNLKNTNNTLSNNAVIAMTVNGPPIFVVKDPGLIGSTTLTAFGNNQGNKGPDAANILSPNGDGKNDTWVIKNLNKYPHNTVKIYDRNGKQVYTKENYSNDWDGTFRGAPLAEDTYYYIVDFGSGVNPIKGFISIVR